MFITFEGIDGSGKTTQLARLASRLADAGLDVLTTKEPDGGRLGQAVRSILTERRSRPLGPVEELLLVGAARHDHFESVIAPALDAGRWVLCDRFVDSTYAYQVHETGVPPTLFEAMSEASLGAVRPDLTFVLDAEPAAARLRLALRATSAPSDPAEAHRDFDRIRRGFRHVALAHPDRCRLVDASVTFDAVASRIWEVARPI